MFGITNRGVYKNKMVQVTQPYDWPALPSGWVHFGEDEDHSTGRDYKNEKEARTALKIVKRLCEIQPSMVEGGVYLITPFTQMKTTLAAQ